ncbi:MAG: hypothetical protein EBY30_16430, partial [Rhodospirillales bacterium]|nr:hypothetical protein [Rhodospirillales bacterium]
MSPTTVMLAVLAVACALALAFLHVVYSTRGTAQCAICRPEPGCRPGEKGQCCCAQPAPDGCWYGDGACQPGLLCVHDGTATGTCADASSAGDYASTSCEIQKSWPKGSRVGSCCLLAAKAGEPGGCADGLRCGDVGGGVGVC